MSIFDIIMRLKGISIFDIKEENIYATFKISDSYRADVLYSSLLKRGMLRN